MSIQAAGQRTLRVGTCNVEYGHGPRNVARLDRLLEADCDVLVLTETHDDLTLPPPYEARHSSPRPGAREGSRWVTVWSRLPVVRAIPTRDAARTVAVELGPGVVVYGTVLPWHSDRGDGGSVAVRNWSEYLRVTPEQGQEWQGLRETHAAALLVVAGDLNH